MPIYDVLLIALGVAGIAWLLWGVLRYGVQRRAPRLVVIGAALAGLSGVVNLLLGGAHLLAVLARPIQGRPVGGAATFEYTFHYYSLVLLGFAVVVPALLLMTRARAVARGEPAAWRTAFWASIILVAVNAPLIPIQGFAPLLSGASVLGLAGLLGARGRSTAAGKAAAIAGR